MILGFEILSQQEKSDKYMTETSTCIGTIGVLHVNGQDIQFNIRIGITYLFCKGHEYSLKVRKLL